MGISKSALNCFLDLKQSLDWDNKSVLQLGRQCILFTLDEMKELMTAKKVPFPSDVPVQLSSFEDLRKKNFIDDVTFFKLLGFGEVYSLDASDFENPSFVHDLNLPVPQALQGRFDFIFDGGTLEHIFHLPQSLSNIHLMLKEKGTIIHSSPSHNYVDHGFYMFSPTLFYDYYHANHYQILKAWFCHHGDNKKDLWKVYNYTPGSLSRFSYGGFGKEMAGTWFVAQKQSESTAGYIPQQGFYLTQWKQASEQPVAKKPKKKSLLKQTIKTLLLLRTYHFFRKRYKWHRQTKQRFLGYF